MEIGYVTGYEVGKSKENDTDTIILHVEMSEVDDIQTVELFGSGGRDYNPPTGASVVVLSVADAMQIAIAVDDGLTPESLPGEDEMYSTDGVEKKARVKCFTDGVLRFNLGGPAAARVGDEIQVTPVTDPKVFVWINAVTAALGVLGQPVAPAPTSITGKITSGSGSVEIGD